MSVADLIEGKRVCVCAGSGGVGKTTVSAALAMGMAARGLRVAVVTIDPAKRLANSLGLDELGNEPQLVDPARFAEEGLPLEGELWAMMLDVKRTFDEVVQHLAPDPKSAEDVLANPIYQRLSTAVAGSQEYTAMTKLYDLVNEADYDLVVLDTPPSRNALEFLDAPDRLTSFLEGRALQVFLKPTGLGMRVFGRGTSVVFSVLRRVTGVDLLEDLSKFFQSLSGMIDGFRERARGVKALLADEDTTFLLVTSPEREPVDEAIFFHTKLEDSAMPFGGAVVNRMHYDTLGETHPDEVAAHLSPELGEDLAGRVAQTLAEYDTLAQRDRDNVARLRRELGDPAVVLVPYLDGEVHDVDGLVLMHRYLFAPEAEREELFADVIA